MRSRAPGSGWLPPRRTCSPSAAASMRDPSSPSRRSARRDGWRTRSMPRDSACGVASATSPPRSSPRAGSGPLHVAICAEYDALPDIGHACGHNLIAALAVGAGLAAAHVADDVGLTVSVVGTPAEESGGGKILLLERGAFAGVHTAMMVHPAPFDMAEPPTLAFSEFEAHFHGKASHASAVPELGVNAADALVVAQTAIGLLRQHIRPDRSRARHRHARRRGAEHRAGAHDGTVLRARAHARRPRRTFARRCCAASRRARSRPDARCASTARPRRTRRSGTTPRSPRSTAATPRRSDGRSSSRVRRMSRFAGSTDMGNVSHAMPSIHPMIGLVLPAGGESPAGVHRPLRRRRQPTASCCDGALALAWTAIDVATDDVLSARLRARPATGATGAR